MVKRSRAERVAKAGARTAGTGLGAFFSNPIVAVIALVLGALLIFRGDITKGISEFKFPELNLPFSDFEFPSFDFKFPDFDFKFPEFKFPEITFPEFPAFPELPDFASIFETFSNQFTMPTEVPTLEEGEEGTGLLEGFVGGEGGEPKLPADKNLFQVVFENIFGKKPTPTEEFQAGKVGLSGLSGTQELINFFGFPFAPKEETEKEIEQFVPTPSSVISLLPSPQQFEIGGTNVSGLPIFGTIQETPITTLTQVLDLFPNLTASQAADFLGEFSGISPAAALLQGGDVINLSSSPDDPPQIFNQSSLGIAGTPQALFDLLFPNLKSNF